MTPTNEPRKHHYVPRAFLERFCVAGKIIVTDLESEGRQWVSNARDTFCERDFYARLQPGSSDRAVFEKIFATTFENDGIRALRRIVDECRLPPLPGLRQAACRYIALQYLRGPKTREGILKEARKLGEKRRRELLSGSPQKVYRTVEQILGRKPTQDDIRHFCSLAKWDIEILEPAVIHLHHLGDSYFDFGDLLEARSWLRFRFATPLLWTSDEPVSLSTESLAPLPAGQGMNEAAFVIVHTDPQNALLLAHPGLQVTSEIFDYGPSVADKLNELLMKGAFRFLVHAPGTPTPNASHCREAPLPADLELIKELRLRSYRGRSAPTPTLRVARMVRP